MFLNSNQQQQQHPFFADNIRKQTATSKLVGPTQPPTLKITKIMKLTKNQ